MGAIITGRGPRYPQRARTAPAPRHAPPPPPLAPRTPERSCLRDANPGPSHSGIGCMTAEPRDVQRGVRAEGIKGRRGTFQMKALGLHALDGLQELRVPALQLRPLVLQVFDAPRHLRPLGLFLLQFLVQVSQAGRCRE